MSSTFKKNIENFSCLKCGYQVDGNGFTNHCPKCLWSRHVDNFPGDRANSCGGLMEPIGLETVAGQYDIIHRCQSCGAVKNNKASKDDDIGTYLTSMLQ